ncbi:MAG: M48 family metalloprotease, partial [Acidobacteriota bacterium]
HYVMKHIWKGLAFTMAVIFFVLLGSKVALDRAVSLFGPRWGFKSPSDPAAVPLLFLIVSVFLFILSPVFSGYSRRTEHQADMFALELTHSNKAGAHSFMKLAEDSKVDPDPGRLIEFWRYGHPALSRRIAFALSYRPWEEGKPNQMWRK